MKVVVTGSKLITDASLVRTVIAEVEMQFGKITELATGYESMVDRIAVEWARQNKIPIKGFQPDFKNPDARTSRSIEMGKAVDLCVFIHKSNSSGTKLAIAQCIQHGIKYYVHEVK